MNLRQHASALQIRIVGMQTHLMILAFPRYAIIDRHEKVSGQSAPLIQGGTEIAHTAVRPCYRQRARPNGYLVSRKSIPDY